MFWSLFVCLFSCPSQKKQTIIAPLLDCFEMAAHLVSDGLTVDYNVEALWVYFVLRYQGS